MYISKPFSTPPCGAIDLPDGEVHIWRIALQQPAPVLGELRELLSGDECERAAHFRFEVHRRRFIVARGALRRILARYLRIDPGKLVFEYEAYGKPVPAAAQNVSGVHFNLSHADELAVCVVVRNRRAGIDIESTSRRMRDADKIARRFFSATESAAFLALPRQEKQQAFFRCWTRKEAFIKAIGEGLTHPLHLFDVAFLPDEPPALLRTRPDPAEAGKWTLLAFDPGEGYTAAAVIEGKDFDVRCYEWKGGVVA